MTTRRDFLQAVALVAPPVIVGGLLLAEGGNGYRPCGHIRAGADAAAMDVEYVTLNGRRVEHVTELDDVEGWIRRVEFGTDSHGNGWERRYHETGDVRVYWRPIA